ncbi:MAG: prepilin-type N-terminal cleavage/methylation domain-containing protein [Chthonomonas sp.]|nr:prepilin-type N-terminal cleavage/methylation domain-containing protein [Chthonomonas sp.]
MARVKQRGFTLAEMGVAVSIGLLALGAVIGTNVAMTNVASKLTAGGSTIKKGVSSIEILTRDLRDSDLLLAQWPPNGNAQFTANESNTLIVRVPKVSGTSLVAGQYNAYIYYLRTQSGADGPFVLTRYQATLNNGNASTATLDRVVATNVTASNFVYTCRETFHGESSYVKFRTRTMPQGDKPGFAQEAWMNGTELLDSGDAEYDGDLLRFAQAPSWGALVDARYSVDPATVVGGEGGCNATDILVTLKIRPTWKNRTYTDQNRTVEISTRMRLRNK